MTSPIYAARQWLHDQLQASSALTGVQVTYGSPVFHQSPEVVALAAVSSVNDEDRVLGGSRIEREFTLDVDFGVYMGGSADNEAVDERGFEFHEAIRSVVMADRTLGGNVRVATPEGLDTEGAVPSDRGGWMIVGSVHIRCATRTT